MAVESVRMTTGERIAWLMRRRSRRTAELAAAVGAHRVTLTQSYIGEKHPIPSDVLARLADELETSTDFLLCRTDDPRPLDSWPKRAFVNGQRAGEGRLGEPVRMWGEQPGENGRTPFLRLIPDATTGEDPSAVPRERDEGEARELAGTP